MSNTLKAFLNLKNHLVDEFNQNYNVLNRINQVGDALEKYIKDLYADSFNLNEEETDEKYSKFFSYTGNKNNPPDAILVGSDAIEIKKVSLSATTIALNSSFPKDYLYFDDPLITNACRQCEKEIWIKKDMVYVIGMLDGLKLRGIWFVYGDCYAADKEVYSRIKNTITNGVEALGIDLAKTNEIAKIKKVDPLGITDLRVRGMWSIFHPSRVFKNLNLRNGNSFFAHLIVSKNKYNQFPEDDRIALEAAVSSNTELIKIDTFIKDPNNPVRRIEAVVVSFYQ